MTPTILILIGGLSLLLVGVGLLGTLLGVRAALSAFGTLETGAIMAVYYVGYIVGTLLVPQVIRHVGHIRVFATFAALGSTTSLAFGLWVHPWIWLALRFLNGLCVVALYMVVESWLNEQSSGPQRGRVFGWYMMSTLVALGAGQFLLLSADPAEPGLFAVAAMLISVGVIPIAATRVTEPRIDLSVPVGLRQLYRVSPLGTWGALNAGVINGAFWGMAPVFAQKLAMPEGRIAWLMGGTILGGALLQWPIGHLSDRLDRRTVLIATSLATALVAGLGGLTLLDNHSGLVINGFFYGGLMFSLYSLSVAHANDRLEPEQVLEATRGLLLVYGIGAFFGPLITGAMMTWIGPVGLPAFSSLIAAALAGFGIWRVWRRSPPPAEQQTAFVALARTSPVALEMHPEADPEPELDLKPRD